MKTACGQAVAVRVNVFELEPQVWTLAQRRA